MVISDTAIRTTEFSSELCISGQFIYKQKGSRHHFDYAINESVFDLILASSRKWHYNYLVSLMDFRALGAKCFVLFSTIEKNETHSFRIGLSKTLALLVLGVPYSFMNNIHPITNWQYKNNHGYHPTQITQAK